MLQKRGHVFEQRCQQWRDDDNQDEQLKKASKDHVTHDTQYSTRDDFRVERFLAVSDKLTGAMSACIDEYGDVIHVLGSLHDSYNEMRRVWFQQGLLSHQLCAKYKYINFCFNWYYYFDSVIILK